jgi:hypothetical protein
MTAVFVLSLRAFALIVPLFYCVSADFAI